MINEVTKQYLEHQRIFLQEASTPEEIKTNVLGIIEEYISTDASPLFLGERAFYHGQYGQALRHYLLVKDLPESHFFCFRAAAFLHERRGESEKALFFAEKALDEQENDPFSKQIADLALSNMDKNNLSDTPEENLRKKLKGSELDELAKIFQNSSQTPPLFEDNLYD